MGLKIGDRVWSRVVGGPENLIEIETQEMRTFRYMIHQARKAKKKRTTYTGNKVLTPEKWRKVSKDLDETIKWGNDEIKSKRMRISRIRAHLKLKKVM